MFYAYPVENGYYVEKQSKKLSLFEVEDLLNETRQTIKITFTNSTRKEFVGSNFLISEGVASFNQDGLERCFDMNAITDISVNPVAQPNNALAAEPTD